MRLINRMICWWKGHDPVNLISNYMWWDNCREEYVLGYPKPYCHRCERVVE
jgi:hypothetical protein